MGDGLLKRHPLLPDTGECVAEGSGPGGQAALLDIDSALHHTLREGISIHLQLKIVDADMKRLAHRPVKQQLQRLRRDLDTLEGTLLLGVAAIRCIPVAVIFLEPPSGACDAPMADLMQRAGKEATCQIDAVIAKL